MDKVTYENKTYYFVDGQIYDATLNKVDEVTCKNVAAIYFANKQIKLGSVADYRWFVLNLNNCSLFEKALDVALDGIKKFPDDRAFVGEMMPIIISCLCVLNRPLAAINFYKRYKTLYKGSDSLQLLIAVAGAYCDTKGYVTALKYADMAYKFQGGEQGGYSAELDKVYQRIHKRGKNNPYINSRSAPFKNTKKQEDMQIGQALYQVYIKVCVDKCTVETTENIICDKDNNYYVIQTDAGKRIRVLRNYPGITSDKAKAVAKYQHLQWLQQKDKDNPVKYCVETYDTIKVIVDNKQLKQYTVVHPKYIDNESGVEYSLVDPENGIISSATELGAMLLGKKVGDEFIFDNPRTRPGTLKQSKLFYIVSLSRP